MLLLLFLGGKRMGKGKGRCGEEASQLAGRFLGLLVGDSPASPAGAYLIGFGYSAVAELVALPSLLL